MFIKKVILHNYRIYYGRNELEFFPNPEKNVFIISGENGFGKTTFLTSLVWCLYGKLMVDVDEKYKREIYESGGYRKYASNNLNRIAAAELEGMYSVSIVLSDIFIPSLLCQEVKVTRTFHCTREDDKVEILIDDQENELTKEVGPEIFINDFILPKEVAKFFFFDAEKIVALAEMKSIEDKRKLSKAYSEVLGIKKYADLKNNLQDLRIRFRRSSATQKDKEKFEEFQKEVKKLHGLIEFNQEQIINLNEEKNTKKRQSEQYQEKLIREGNSLTVEELLNLKTMRDKLGEEGKKIRTRMKELLELAPFAIAGKKFSQTRNQLHREVDKTLNELNPAIVKEKIKKIKANLQKETFKSIDIEKHAANKILTALEQYISTEFLCEEKKDGNVLLAFSETERNEFEAIYNNLKRSFSNSFKQLVQEEKSNRITFTKIVRKISNAESKENDLLIKEIREKKTDLDDQIIAIDEKTAKLNQDIGGWQRDVAVMSRHVSELSKKIHLEQLDKEKDKTAQRLVERLEEFILKLKSEKKAALEARIKFQLNLLMHKSDFIHRVEVEVNDEIIDIHLFNKKDKAILKESLSKGEQQLYATSILKALVDESNVKFPIFIDSPLQKFDKRHSKNIICEFYPNVSEQVVLFPLLEKELTENEYKTLMPKVNTTYRILNINEDSSKFQRVEPGKLFTAYKEDELVYAH